MGGGFGVFLAINLALVALLAYTMICGNNKFHRDGKIGALFRFIVVKIPSYCSRLYRKVTPKRCQMKDGESCVGNGGPCKYFIFIFFVIIYLVFSISYITKAYPVINHYSQHATFRKWLGIMILPWPWICVIMFKFVNPGVVTESNVVSYLEHYPHDNVIYKPKLCPTLHIPVVPRSRYCTYTHRRIAKYDHYCPWVLSSVGERTHRIFLLFLISCTAASAYYAYGSVEYLQWRFSMISNRIRWSESKITNFSYIIIICINIAPMVSGTAMILSVIAVALLFFVLQQVWFISKNMTQIEIDKFEYENEKRKLNGINEKAKNIYDHGFFQNWKEFLFPPKIATNKPLDWSQYPKVDPREVAKAAGKSKRK